MVSRSVVMGCCHVGSLADAAVQRRCSCRPRTREPDDLAEDAAQFDRDHNLRAQRLQRCFGSDADSSSMKGTPLARAQTVGVVALESHNRVVGFLRASAIVGRPGGVGGRAAPVTEPFRVS